MKLIKYAFEFIIIIFLFLIFKIVGLKISRNISGFIFKNFGSFFRSMKTSRANLSIAFPNFNEMQKDKTIHNMWFNMFELADEYVKSGMTAYVNSLQEKEFSALDRGYTFSSHQQEVGAGYFDAVTTVIQGGSSSVTALAGSTEEEQFSIKS